MKFLLVLILTLLVPTMGHAQLVRNSPSLSGMDRRSNPFASSDSIEKTDVPRGIYAWTVDKRFGTIRQANYDTIPHLFQNDAFTSGRTGHYNYTGNAGAPRISRHFNEQSPSMMQNPFIFTLPYDFVVRSDDEVLYTNTKSPFTNITYHECGNKTNGEDRLTALFSVNSGKKLGLGFRADYLYGRGYYDAQSTAHFNGNLFASYIDEKYQMHLNFTYRNLKNRENGGIENDDYVNRPESFPTKYGTSDMPVNLERAWNKIYGDELFLTHRYNIGFRRYRDESGRIVRSDALPTMLGVRTDTLNTDSVQVATTKKVETVHTIALTESPDSMQQAKATIAKPRMPRLATPSAEEEQERRRQQLDSLGLRTEFVPVTSFIHTLKITGLTRRFLSNSRNNTDTPGFFSDFYLEGDSAADLTRHLGIENTLAFELHEGFNKWMKTGLRLFAKHEFQRFSLPDADRRETRYVENYIRLGAQLLKEEGNIFRYHALGELRTSGTDWGEFNVEADASLHIPLRSDSLHFEACGFVRNERPSFYYRHYHARNAWWDNTDLNKVLRTRVSARLRYKQTALSATLENVQNQLYFIESLVPYNAEDGYVNYRHGVGVGQASKNVQLVSASLSQDFAWGPLHWDTELTWQTSTNKQVLPIPTFTGYTNLYLSFRIAKVLRTELGADLRYFTSYYAPTYSPLIGQYVLQDATYAVKTGNYPIVNAYANFHLKNTRFYLMASHVNYSSGTGNPFLVPHYPINRMVIRFGISWNFIN